MGDLRKSPIIISDKIQMTNIPQHVAIIMDGNGRWAKRKGLPKIAGHRAGVKAVKEAIEAARDLGVKILTLYTFSTENWKRPKKEIDALFRLLEEYLNREEKNLIKNKIRFSVIGNLDELPSSTRMRLGRVMESTKDGAEFILNLALNYGSRAEILNAVRAVSRDISNGRIGIEDIDEGLFSGYLYTKNLPDPDLLIRTSGEYRISNFLLWQISYAELYVTKKFWPDFKKNDFKSAVLEFQKRKRRFGG